MRNALKCQLARTAISLLLLDCRQTVRGRERERKKRLRPQFLCLGEREEEGACRRRKTTFLSSFFHQKEDYFVFLQNNTVFRGWEEGKTEASAGKEQSCTTNQKEAFLFRSNRALASTNTFFVFFIPRRLIFFALPHFCHLLQ